MNKTLRNILIIYIAGGILVFVVLMGELGLLHAAFAGIMWPFALLLGIVGL